MLGAARTVCMHEKIWDAKTPVCRPISCPNLKQIENGWVKANDIFYNSTATYGCHEGFRLKGGAVRTCQATALWSGEDPRCEIVTCGDPFPVTHAYLIFSDTSYGSAVEYYCDEGYKIDGPIQRICGSDGRWSGTKPSCKQIHCSELPAIANGQVNITDTVLGSSAIYTCHPGYDLVSSAIRTCRKDELWSGTEPHCRPVSCSKQALHLNNGNVIGEGRTYGTVLQYQCISGYEIVGPASRKCMQNGEWSDEPPTCRKVTCQTPLIPLNGNLHGNDFTFDNVITYSCNKGFQLIGPEQSACSADGNWISESPSCSPVTCPELPPFPNGQREFSKNTFNSSLRYHCQDGFYLSGPEHRVCQENGHWSNREPECFPITCPTPPEIPDGYYIGNKSTAGSVLTVACHVGHYLNPERATIVCDSNGAWFATLGATCQKVKCPPVENIQYGSVTGNKFMYGSMVYFSCDPGWQLVGEQAAVCMESGRWNSTDSFCIGTTCPGLEPVPNSKATSSSRAYGTVVTYECLLGYELVGENNITCSINNEWSSSAPRCVPVSCRKPQKVHNGKRIGESYVFLSNVTYECNPGYEIMGSEVLTCLENATWSGDVPFCREITCPLPNHIFNGEVVVENKPKETIDGHLLSEKHRGDIAVDVDIILEDENQEFLHYGDKVFHYCFVGYNLEGPQYRTCQSDGTWSGVEPFCKPVTCGILASPMHGNVNQSDSTFRATASYWCDEGYYLVGYQTRQCLINGSWSSPSPECKLVECYKPQPIPHGTVNWTSLYFRSTAFYSCNTMYRLEGTKTRTCNHDGTWTDTEPRCKIIECQPPEEIENGQVQVASVHVGGISRYICNDGYKLIGEPLRSCLANSSWSNLEAECHVVRCSEHPEIENGYVYAKNLTFESVMRYKCREGFTLEGIAERRCLASGTWSSHVPWCAPIRCHPPPVPMHAQMEADKLTLGGTVSFTCHEGFRLLGPKKLTCTQSGNWSNEMPRCKMVTCAPIQNLTYGVVHGTSYTFRSVLYFDCQPKYKLMGRNEIRCSSSGKWSHKLPSCERYLCSSLPKDDNVIWPETENMHRGAYIVGSTIYYSCHLGYVAATNATYYCDENGRWKGEVVSCVRIQCGPLPTIARGVHNGSEISNHTYGNVASYSCSDGYMLYGSQSVVCKSDGHWSEPVPECRKEASCQPPASVENAFHYGRKREYAARERLELFCYPGYRSSGIMTVTCRNDGSWSQVSGSCVSSQNAGVSSFCQKKCQNGGVCVGRNWCRCLLGYAGKFCQQPICILPCLNGGTCIAPYRCHCTKNYTGSRCQRYIGAT